MMRWELKSGSQADVLEGNKDVEKEKVKRMVLGLGAGIGGREAYMECHTYCLCLFPLVASYMPAKKASENVFEK